MQTPPVWVGIDMWKAQLDIVEPEANRLVRDSRPRSRGLARLRRDRCAGYAGVGHVAC